MISINKSFKDEDDGWHKSLSEKQIKKLIKAVFNTDEEFSEGTHHISLSPNQIQKIISYLMYSEDNISSITLKIDKNQDDYHLDLFIDKVEK